MLVWVKLVFKLKCTVSLDILLQWNYCALQVNDQSIEGLPKPRVLINLELLVALIRNFRLLRWDYWSLDSLGDVGLEKMAKKHWLKMRNFL